MKENCYLNVFNSLNHQQPLVRNHMTRKLFVIFKDEKLHGDENAADKKDCLHSNHGTSDWSSSKNTKEQVPDSKYHY
jgi:hypothetical protein